MQTLSQELAATRQPTKTSLKRKEERFNSQTKSSYESKDRRRHNVTKLPFVLFFIFEQERTSFYPKLDYSRWILDLWDLVFWTMRLTRSQSRLKVKNRHTWSKTNAPLNGRRKGKRSRRWYKPLTCPSDHKFLSTWRRPLREDEGHDTQNSQEFFLFTLRV